MMAGKPKVRFRWRRTVTIFVVGYLAYWSVVSLHHIVVISHQEASLSQKISTVRNQNRILDRDIQTLHNPQQLKEMLAGKKPLPNPNP